MIILGTFGNHCACILVERGISWQPGLKCNANSNGDSNLNRRTRLMAGVSDVGEDISLGPAFFACKSA